MTSVRVECIKSPLSINEDYIHYTSMEVISKAKSACDMPKPMSHQAIVVLVLIRPNLVILRSLYYLSWFMVVLHVLSLLMRKHISLTLIVNKVLYKK